MTMNTRPRKPSRSVLLAISDRHYLEMIKLRLYEGTPDEANGARWTLRHVFLTVLKLLAPILPYVTEEIYRHLFAPPGRRPHGSPYTVASATVAPTSQSIHLSRWPTPDESLEDDWIESAGDTLVQAVTACAASRPSIAGVERGTGAFALGNA